MTPIEAQRALNNIRAALGGDDYAAARRAIPDADLLDLLEAIDAERAPTAERVLVTLLRGDAFRPGTKAAEERAREAERAQDKAETEYEELDAAVDTLREALDPLDDRLPEAVRKAIRTFDEERP